MDLSARLRRVTDGSAHRPISLLLRGRLGEHPNIHVARERAVARSRLAPVNLERSWGFSAGELRKVEELVEVNATEFLEAWHEFFRR